MRRSCPWCREPLGVADHSAARCSGCGRPLEDDQGRELRPLDLRYEGVEGRLWQRFQRMLLVGMPTMAVVSLAMPALSVTAVALAPLLAVAHLVAIRLYLMREPRRWLSGVRRRSLRWLTRLGFLWLGMPGYAMAAAPVAGVVAVAATFAGLTTATWAYTRWSLAEERDREPMARWERWLLWTLVAVTFVALAALAAVAALVGWSAAALFSK